MHDYNSSNDFDATQRIYAADYKRKYKKSLNIIEDLEIKIKDLEKKNEGIEKLKEQLELTKEMNKALYKTVYSLEEENFKLRQQVAQLQLQQSPSIPYKITCDTNPNTRAKHLPEEVGMMNGSELIFGRYKD